MKGVRTSSFIENLGSPVQMNDVRFTCTLRGCSLRTKIAEYMVSPNKNKGERKRIRESLLLCLPVKYIVVNHFNQQPRKRKEQTSGETETWEV
ncbi:hypothetical protein BDE02_13G030300 [Populus trichocarpa]|nr:hypothetical protein BDE02_13G030300 [Populus trichocarpa]